MFLHSVKIKELESELLKTTSQLGVEKRRTSTLEVRHTAYS